MWDVFLIKRLHLSQERGWVVEQLLLSLVEIVAIVVLESISFRHIPGRLLLQHDTSTFQASYDSRSRQSYAPKRLEVTPVETI